MSKEVKKSRKSKKTDAPVVEEAKVEAPEVVKEDVAVPEAAVETETPKVTTTTEATEKPKAEEKVKEEEKMEVEPEKPKDVEEDAAEDKSKRISHVVAMNGSDSLVNTLVSDDTILFGMSLGALQGLYCGVRGNTGVKSGRYLYEAKVVEQRDKMMHLKFGFSTAKADLLGGENCFLFSTSEGNFINGAAKPVSLAGTKSVSVNDVISVLVNRVEGSEQCNTLSLFINGERRSAPQKIEVGADEALFPHVMFKGCSVNMNFGQKLLAPLVFSCRTLSDASRHDVVTSTVKPIEGEPEVVFPIGFDCEEWLAEFLKTNPMHIPLTIDAMKNWFEKSGMAGRHLPDQGKSIGHLSRARNFVVALNKDGNNGILERERKSMCGRFPGYKKIAKVMLAPPKDNKTYSMFSQVTMPTDAEGFDVVEYILPKEENEAKLEEWKAECQLRSLVTDLKVGPVFKEKVAAFRKLCEEKKADKEAFPEFKQENYMLATLRMELHYVLHCFKEDVGDEARTGFCEDHYGHYFKKYRNMDFNPKRYGLNSAREVVEEYADDTVEFNAKGLMLPKLEKDVEQITFLNLEEDARDSRKNREDAGDEMAKLKFTAQPPKHQHPGKPNFIPGAQKPALGPNSNVAYHQRRGGPPQHHRMPVHVPQFQKRPPPAGHWMQDPKRARR